MPGDGKSVVAANLAIFIANTGKNTILIDADFVTRYSVSNLTFQIIPWALAMLYRHLICATTANVPDQQQLPYLYQNHGAVEYIYRYKGTIS